MTTYLRNILYYFENVIHPAGGTELTDKRKRRSRKITELQSSPDSANIRGAVKKQDKSRMNPAP
jgi:hypothetical protein